MSRAIVPDLQAMLIDQMKSSHFSITTDKSNNQGLEKMITYLSVCRVCFLMF